MKKNIFIISLIFILPILAYFILSEAKAVPKAKNDTNANCVNCENVKPKIIKFSSPLCYECKKIKKVFDDILPKYKNNVIVIEYNVQENKKEVLDAIDNYHITLVPTVIFVDKNGNEVLRTEGYVEKETFEKHVEKLLK